MADLSDRGSKPQRACVVNVHLRLRATGPQQHRSDEVILVRAHNWTGA